MYTLYLYALLCFRHLFGLVIVIQSANHLLWSLSLPQPLLLLDSHEMIEVSLVSQLLRNVDFPCLMIEIMWLLVNLHVIRIWFGSLQVLLSSLVARNSQRIHDLLAEWLPKHFVFRPTFQSAASPWCLCSSKAPTTSLPVPSWGCQWWIFLKESCFVKLCLALSSCLPIKSLLSARILLCVGSWNYLSKPLGYLWLLFYFCICL